MKATWKILDYGKMPNELLAVDDLRRRQVVVGRNDVEFECPGCGYDAMLPVVGVVIAATRDGLVFDTSPHAMPKVIECRRCRRRFEGER